MAPRLPARVEGVVLPLFPSRVGICFIGDKQRVVPVWMVKIKEEPVILKAKDLQFSR